MHINLCEKVHRTLIRTDTNVFLHRVMEFSAVVVFDSIGRVTQRTCRVLLTDVLHCTWRSGKLLLCGAAVGTNVLQSAARVNVVSGLHWSLMIM